MAGVWVEAKLGEGSKFFSHCLSPTAAVMAIRSSALLRLRLKLIILFRGYHMDGLKFRVLLVEDDEGDQMMFTRMVEEERLDYDYSVASSVSQAKEQLGEKVFDIVIADYMLGDSAAFGMLQVVDSIPVIIVTWAGDEEVTVKAWRAGVCDYLKMVSRAVTLRLLPLRWKMQSGTRESKNDSYCYPLP